MHQLYDRADIYDLIESEARMEITRNDWKNLLAGKAIQTFLDVSIGTGGMTLPLQELGIEVYGSDLSDSMLERCRKKALKKQKPLELRCCDFRDLSVWGGKHFDCVASTGNSLAYVSNDDILKVLEEMDAHVRHGGYICFDSRNWEKIKQEKQRFYLYNPFFHGEDRINLVQVWDHNPDGTITFNLLYTFERDNRIFQKEIFVEQYHPFRLELVERKLRKMGYGSLKLTPVPDNHSEADLSKTEWYRMIAHKE